MDSRSLAVGENQSRRDLTKVAQYEVLGCPVRSAGKMMQKEMPVPAGTIEMFNSSSLTYSFASVSGQSIVPSGTGHYL